MLRELAVTCAILSASVDAAAQRMPVPPNTGVCQTADEERLLQRVNQYRSANGRLPIPSSIWMATTAQWHAWDLSANDPATATCTLRSWSSARPGLWEPVCYTADDSQINQMLLKPEQISQFNYRGLGVELVVRGPFQAPEEALAAIVADPGYADILLERGAWVNTSFKSLGTGMVGDYATVWLGLSIDHEGVPTCPPPGTVFRDGFESEGLP